jgi:Arc/MetJ-type ribon-helix-helix transcriptional regulator
MKPKIGEKVMLRIPKELLDWIDAKVEKGIFATRSHAIRYALIKLKEREQQK